MHNILIILKHGCIIDYYTCVTDPVDAHATRMTIGTMARRRRGRRDDGAMMSASLRATFCRPPDDMEGREGRERRAACSRARGLPGRGEDRGGGDPRIKGEGGIERLVLQSCLYPSLDNVDMFRFKKTDGTYDIFSLVKQLS